MVAAGLDGTDASMAVAGHEPTDATGGAAGSGGLGVAHETSINTTAAANALIGVHLLGDIASWRQSPGAASTSALAPPGANRGAATVTGLATTASPGLA